MQVNDVKRIPMQRSGVMVRRLTRQLASLTGLVCFTAQKGHAHFLVILLTAPSLSDRGSERSCPSLNLPHSLYTVCRLLRARFNFNSRSPSASKLALWPALALRFLPNFCPLATYHAGVPPHPTLPEACLS